MVIDWIWYFCFVEELVYAELYKRDIRKKEKEELIKELERQRKVAERNNVLH